MCVRNEPDGGQRRPPHQTIIDAALDRERPFLSPEEADAEIRRLTLLVGELETENRELEREDYHKEKIGVTLVGVIHALCHIYCGLRDHGFCDQQCPGRNCCDTDGLVVIILGLGQNRGVQGG